MNEILHIPVPKTPEGAHKLGVALDAQLRAERWAGLRRTGSLVALAAGGAVVVDTTFALLGALTRRAFIAVWWVALSVAVVAAVAEVWATLRLQRIVTEIGREAGPSDAEPL